MKRLIICVIGVIFFNSVSVYSQTLIYDDINGFLYLGEIANELKKREELKDYRIKSSKKIYKVNIKEQITNLLIDSERSIGQYKISSKGYIALSTYWLKKGEDSAKNVLLIYNKEGTKVKEIKHVQISSINYNCFSWSPDGEKIAYVTGDPTRDEKYGPFSPTGVWIYDIEKNQIEKVGSGFGVNWSAHDGNLYIQTNYLDTYSDGFVFDRKSGISGESDKHGLIFSDDGEYYVGKESSEEMGVGPSYDVYSNQANKSVYQFKVGSKGPQEMWSGYATFISGSHYLLMWTGGKFYKIFDVDNKTVIRKAKHALLGWNKYMTKAVVYENGKIHIDEMLTGKRLMSLDLPE